MQQEAIGAFIDYLNRRSRIDVGPWNPVLFWLRALATFHPATVPVELVREGDRAVLKIISDLRGVNVLDHFLVQRLRQWAGILSPCCFLVERIAGSQGSER